MFKILSYIVLGIFLLTHLYWQINLYQETKKIKTKSFRSVKEQIEKLKQESELPDKFFNRISLSRKVSKYALGVYLMMFLYMLIKNLI